MNWSEMNYWNQNSYGNAFRVKKSAIHLLNVTLGVVIPAVYPVSLALLINKYIFKKDLVVRYD